MTLQVPLTTVTGGSNAPNAIPREWSSIEVLGVTYGPANPDGVSGKVIVRRGKRHYKWQKKDPPGADGYTSTYHGISPKEFDLVFIFWTIPQYDRLAGQIIPLLQISGTKGKTNPVPVYHPGLFSIGIGQVTTDFIMMPEPFSEEKPDLWRWVVQVTEYLPPPPVNTSSTPITPLSGMLDWAPGASSGQQPNPAITALLKANAALRQQLAGAPPGPPGPFG
jgi:hypothetical protein